MIIVMAAIVTAIVRINLKEDFIVTIFAKLPKRD